MSLQQRHMWRWLELEASGISNASCEIWLEGKLEVERLRAAIEEVIRRHEILRTLYERFAGLSLPLQVISQDLLLAFSSYDLQAETPAGQRSRLDQLRQELAREHSQLEHGPVLRAAVCRCEAERYLLLLSMPALSMDTVSLQNLISELCAAYTDDNYVAEQATDIFQYADFAEWQQELVEAPETQKATDYWLNPRLLAALDRPLLFEQARADQAFRMVEKAFTVPTPLLSQIEAFVDQHAVPPAIFFQTCWQILLWRLLGKAEYVLGVANNERKHEELTGALGLFAQYLPMLCDFADEQTFVDALSQVAEQTGEMRKWQEFFNWEALQKRSPDETYEPFAHAAFSWQQYESMQSAGVVWNVSVCRATIDRSSLCLTCTQYSDRLQFALLYDALRVSEEEVARIIEAYQMLLSSALEQSSATLDVLKTIGPYGQQQVLRDWNSSEYEPAYAVQKLFEAQAERRPQAKALVVANRCLTYAELNQQASKLARVLRGLKIGLDDRVGLYLERSVEQVTGLLGILKAGGAYVPLDPAWPAERLNRLLQENPLRLILTSAAVSTPLPQIEGVHTLCIEDVLAEPDMDEEPYLRSVEVLPAQLAYVLYTSGSTGLPKGVAITHGNLAAYTSSILKILNLPEGCNYATAASLAVDLGNTAMYAALSSGGCLHLLSWEQANDPLTWAAYLQENAIDCVKMVPSHLAALLTGPYARQSLPVHCLVLGGETLNWEVAQQVQALRPECRLLNHYGPTESTVGVLTYQVGAGESEAWQQRWPRTESVPLGKPLAHAQAYVLDRLGEPVPVWEIGELYLGGEGIARGYAGNVELTAERFVPDPWSREPGKRLYRTGDRARWLPDGTLEFLGRVDRQVKVRGYRIELGEIEQAFRRQAEVRECVVELREDAQSEPRLVAYVVLHTGVQALTSAELRAAARQYLPDYMAPAACIVLDKLPLTPAGKIDRQALRLLDPAQFDQEKSYVAPRTEAETQLAQIWQQVLGRQPIGVQDNFFALGGDSILSIQIVARASQAGLRLTPRQLFQSPTIAELAQSLDVQPKQAQARAAQGVLFGRVPLTPIQRWFWEQDLAEPWHYNQAVFLQPRTRLQRDALDQAVRALLAQHDALRLRVWSSEQGWQQEYGPLPPQEEPVVEYCELSAVTQDRRAEEVEKRAQQEQSSLKLEAGRLLRVVLFELGEREPQRVLLVGHHLAVDGVSWRILLEDLQLAYQQAQAGEPINLGTKTSSYQQWANWLEEYANSPEMQAQAVYWRERLRLAREWAEEASEDQAGESSLEVALEEEETRALLQEVPGAYHTQINEVLLTALGRSLANWQGQRVVRIDMEGHGREERGEEIEVSRTVGWFTTLYPVVLEIEGGESIERDVQSVKEQVRAIPDHGLGYGLLRYLSVSEATRDIHEQPWGQIRLNYLGQIDQVLREEWWQPAKESTGNMQSPANERPYHLEVNALVADGKLRMNWSYERRFYRESTVENLAGQFAAQLRAIIAYCRQLSNDGFTSVEFSDVELSQSELDDLLADIG